MASTSTDPGTADVTTHDITTTNLMIRPSGQQPHDGSSDDGHSPPTSITTSAATTGMFDMTPLKERSLWTRLDVGPFLIVYLCWILLDLPLSVWTWSDSTAVPFDDDGRAMNTWLTTTTITSIITVGLIISLLFHVALVLATQWDVRIKVLVGYRTLSCTTTTLSQWTHCWVVQHAEQPTPMSSATAPAASGLRSVWRRSSSLAQHQQQSTSSTVAAAPAVVMGIVAVRLEEEQHGRVATIHFHDQVFRCAEHVADFEDVLLWQANNGTSIGIKDGMSNPQQPDATLRFRALHYPTQEPLSFYQNWKGHATMHAVMRAGRLYSLNQTVLQLPRFADLLAEQLAAPFFVFQCVCVLLWSLDEYWYYALFTASTLLLFESTVAYNRLVNLQRLHRAGHAGHDQVWTCRPAPTATTTTTTTKGSQPLSKQWVALYTRELIPGDLISLSQPNQTVPADVLLLVGTAVVDEALLTGESIPQLKHPLDSTTIGSSAPSTSAANHDTCLDVQDAEHKESILFGGTVLLVSNSSSGSDYDNTDDDACLASSAAAAALPLPPPDGGALVMVLRTGFETAQGNLLRTMAHGSPSASDKIHTADTFVFIAGLVCCALVAAIMVLQAGWADERRNRFRLLLHVIMIITSVVPPELPMELSLAVTNSVQTLMRSCNVYCTEHFRIPVAGEVNVCCFDKTGTLTSDEMLLRGIQLLSLGTQRSKNNKTKESDDPLEDLVDSEWQDEDGLIHPDRCKPDEHLPWPAIPIMAACHSLAVAQHAATVNTKHAKRSRRAMIGDPLEKTVFSHTGYSLCSNNRVIPSLSNNNNNNNKAISILHRFAFSSKRKRMAVLVTEEGGQGIVWAFCKGSPEIIQSLCLPESIPANYHAASLEHMSRGRRVLAMAYKEVGELRQLQQIKQAGRQAVECDLIFVGFLVLDCPLKADSRAVIQELKKSGHRTVMITGDAVLTAAEVARQVGMIRKSTASMQRHVYRVQARSKEDELEGGPTDDPFRRFECVLLKECDSNATAMPLAREKLAKLAHMAHQGQAFFCITGDVLAAIAKTVVVANRNQQQHGAKAVWDGLEEKHFLLTSAAQTALVQIVPMITVFARHAPHEKEAVLAAWNRAGYQTLMCGDGTNDVGALKRAHVGISIISAPGVESKHRKASATLAAAGWGQQLGGKGRHIKSGKRNKAAPMQSSSASMEGALQQLRDAQEELEQVELGDASVAAPFTSRQISIKCCKDVIQHGRCTLVTMLQIYKILGINCLVNAMVLSRLFLHGVKQGDRQLTALGLAVAALFYFVTRARPLPTLSIIRPPNTVLCPQALWSMFGQCCIHWMSIHVATTVGLAFVDPYDPSLVPDGPFNPNVLNSCTFLMMCIATINTFAVNYRGRPFMEDLHKNKLLYRSLLLCYAVLVACALEIFPPLNELMQLSTLPSVVDAWDVDAGEDNKRGIGVDIDNDNDDGAVTAPSLLSLHPVLRIILVMVDFPVFLCALMAIDTVMSFGWERFVLRTF